MGIAELAMQLQRSAKNVNFRSEAASERRIGLNLFFSKNERNYCLNFSIWRFGAVGSDVGQINGVTLRRARLVLGWVTVSGFNSLCGKSISI